MAEEWVVGNVSKSSWLLVDDANWVDLIRRGFAAERTIWFYKMDLDPAIRPPKGWRSIDYLLATEVLRGQLAGLPRVRSAYENSEVVAVFGEGPQRVEVRAVVHR
jgi:hypothetical protein